MAEPESPPRTDDQLAGLAGLIRLLDDHGWDYWLFGGWAVDFWVGAVTRSHHDIDLAVWHDDRDAIDAALQAGGWRRTSVSDEAVGAGYRRHGVLTELTFVVADDEGRVFIPFSAQPGLWSTEPFGQTRRTLSGVNCRIVPLKLLVAGKSVPRDDPDDAAKDRADFQALTQASAMASVTIRSATPADADFLTDMLVEAVNWEPHRHRSREEIMADPPLAHYVSGWMRPDDLGAIAVAPSGLPVGAAWLRYLPTTDPGYGFVRDDVPELSMGVVTSWRGRGVGRTLLRSVLAAARAAGVAAVSLSVERANFAARLYESEGFRTVESFDHSDTMLADLDA